MTSKAMRFVGPTGAVFALLHVVPRPGELLYSPDSGRTFYEVRFTSKRGQYAAGHIEVEYEFRNPLTGRKETLIHHNSVIMRGSREVVYRIDHKRRNVRQASIIRLAG